jgi:hypothetical protein
VRQGANAAWKFVPMMKSYRGIMRATTGNYGIRRIIVEIPGLFSRQQPFFAASTPEY